MVDLSLRIILSAQDNTKAGMKALSQMNDYMGKIGPVAGVAGAALMLVGGATAYAVKAASDYQSSLLKVQAYAGMTAQETQKMSEQILQMAPALGQSPKALADGLYFVASAGFKGADGLRILREAGMTAAASNVSASVTSFALVSSLNALGLKANSSGNVMDMLNATVKNGLMTWDQYGAVVGKIAGSVNVAGGSAKMMQSNFVALNAGLDVYTNAGISAHQASQWLSADMSLLYGKAGSLASHAEKLKLSFDKNKYATMDFAQRVAYLNQVVGGNHDKLVALLGGNSQVANSVQFLNNNYKGWGSTISDINSKMRGGQTTQQMFNVAQQGAAFQAAKMQAALQVLAITIGSRLLPVVTQIMAAVTPLIGKFAAWASTIQANSPVLAILGGVLAGLAVIVMAAVVPALISAAAGFLAITVAGAPLWIIVIAVIAAVAGLILVIQHWGQITKWLQGVWAAFTAWFHSAMTAVGAWFAGIWNSIASFFVGIWNHITSAARTTWSSITAFFVGVWNGVVNALRIIGMVLLAVIIGPVGLAIIYIVTHWTQVKAFLTAVWMAIVALATSIWNNIVHAIANAIQTVVGWFSWLYHHNYYFQYLVDGIRTIISAVVAWLTSTWSNVSTFISSRWQWLSLMARVYWTVLTMLIQAKIQQVVTWLQAIWTTVTGFIGSRWQFLTMLAQVYWTVLVMIIQAKIQQAVAWLQGAWNSAVAFLQGIWNTIVNTATGMWNRVSSLFASAWATYIAGPLSSLWNSFVNWFNNLKNMAIQWGKGLIQGFIDGINSMVSSVGGAAQNIINTVAGYLGFHSPARFGEGRHIIEWGENAVKGFMRGLQNMQPQLQTQMNAMIQAPRGGNTTNISRGPVTLNVTVQMGGSGNSTNDASQLARLLGDHLRAQFGNI